MTDTSDQFGDHERLKLLKRAITLTHHLFVSARPGECPPHEWHLYFREKAVSPYPVFLCVAPPGPLAMVDLFLKAWIEQVAPLEAKKLGRVVMHAEP